MLILKDRGLLIAHKLAVSSFGLSKKLPRKPWWRDLEITSENVKIIYNIV